MLQPGTTAPTFSLPDQAGNQVSLTSLRGGWVVLWWYPEAGSGGCSLQAISLKAKHDQIRGLGAAVVGASFNTVTENDAFSCDGDLGYKLLSDANRTVGAAYEVVRGPDEPHADKPRRITYLIDPDGTIAHAELADEFPLGAYGDHVLDELRRLQAAPA